MLLLSFGCLVTVNDVQLFLNVLWVGLQIVIVVFPDHTHLRFGEQREMLHIVKGKAHGYYHITRVLQRPAYLTASDTNYMIYLPCIQKSRFELLY